LLPDFEPRREVASPRVAAEDHEVGLRVLAKEILENSKQLLEIEATVRQEAAWYVLPDVHLDSEKTRKRMRRLRSSLA